jgi:proline iminopeptidase
MIPMRKLRILTAVLFSAASVVFSISCYNLDVRMGMGDGSGVGLAYRIVGRGSALVVIHDGPGYEKSLMYGGFDKLSSDLRVIYYDQRGCGKSEPLSPVMSSTIADNIEDLEALRRYFHLEKFSIAAHGWGAVIALEYARRYQVLSQPTMSIVERKERIMGLVIPSLFYREESARAVNLKRVRLSPEVNIRLSDELGSLDLFPVLDEITVPTLVIVGRHDITTPVRDQMAYADGIRSASAVVFNESGHFPFVEERAFFMNVMREFLLRGRIPTLVKAIDPS